MSNRVYYWISQHTSMRFCQWLYDRSLSFRLWWGFDPPILPPGRWSLNGCEWPIPIVVDKNVEVGVIELRKSDEVVARIVRV